MLLGAVAAACSSPAPVRPAEAPTLLLQPADLPQGFVRFDEGRVPRGESPRGEASWRARYRWAGDRAPVGAAVVESRAEVFLSDDDAAEALESYGAEFERAVGTAARGSRLLSLPAALGEEGDAATLLQPGVPREVRFYLFAWRRANVLAFVSISGFVDALELREALSLARKVDARVSRATDG